MNHRQEEESSSTSSEEEDGDPQLNEELYGKVVAVEDVSTGDKKKPVWFPALVSHFPEISLALSSVNRLVPLSATEYLL